MSYVNRDGLNSFPICIHLIFFSPIFLSRFIVQAIASSTKLKMTEDNEQPCLILELIDLRLSPFGMKLSMGLPYIALIMLRSEKSSRANILPQKGNDNKNIKNTQHQYSSCRT